MTVKASFLNKEFRPFVKWAGGKRGLMPELLKRVPQDFNDYFEPFVGGGALFFELKKLGRLDGKKVYLFDKNSELINAYRVIQETPQKLISALRDFQKEHSKEFYYKTREMDREADFKNLPKETRAARLIYLNKTCFNGLYRVNKSGYFNVPMGSYNNPKICDEGLIFSCSIALQGVELLNECYSKVLKLAKKDDFVYLDPPYYPLSVTSSFTAYGEDIFLENEQKELFEVFKKLDKRGCYVMESNSSSDFIDRLYENYKIYCIVYANRSINSKISNRNKVDEFLIRSHKWSK